MSGTLGAVEPGRMELVSRIGASPYSLSDAKKYLGVEFGTLDGDIQQLLDAATETVEDYTHSTIWRANIKLVMDRFPGVSAISLPRGPLISVQTFRYYLASDPGTPVDFPQASYYQDTVSGVLVLNTGQAWPTETLRSANGVEITYEAGRSTVRPALVMGIKAILGEYYKRRSAGELDLPKAATRMLATILQDDNREII